MLYATFFIGVVDRSIDIVSLVIVGNDIVEDGPAHLCKLFHILSFKFVVVLCCVVGTYPCWAIIL